MVAGDITITIDGTLSQVDGKYYWRPGPATYRSNIDGQEYIFPYWYGPYDTEEAARGAFQKMVEMIVARANS